MGKTYKIVMHVPVESAEKMRELLNELGAGHIGDYDYATFSVKGTGRFRPLIGAKPAKGKVGQIEKVEEEMIETVISNVTRQKIKEVYNELREQHPYEEPSLQIIKLEDV